MRVEKQGSMGGGGRYVGGFLHLFDWNAKSRNKLFSRAPILSEQPKQKKSSHTSMPVGGLSRRDHSCTLALTDEDDYANKAPGVVARLMGLDSFPASNISDAHSDPSQKPRAIEKFQTETLPPKSARSVPITRHNLLSPIKSSGFVSLDNPACIMEAASKIPLVGSSSSPVRFSSRNPVKISETCRRPVESSVAKNLKRQSPKPFTVLEDGKKSVSLALQAKVNIQKRDSLTLSVGKSPYRAEPIKSQPNTRVLRPNNRKQNCLANGGKSGSKSSSSSVDSRCQKPVSGKNSAKTSGTLTNKTGNRRKQTPVDDNEGIRDKSDRSGTDVVSFTFTSPMPCSILRPMNSLEKKNACLADNHGKKALVGEIIDHIITFCRVQLVDAGFSKKPATPEGDTESSDSGRGTESEPGYVKDILSDIELMFDDFTVGRTCTIMGPVLFDQLEARRPVLGKLRRKLVFDCVRECVDSRCRVWAQGLGAVRQKDQLAKEVFYEISGWEAMKDRMVDELVEEDMSGYRHKKWLDFDVEAFELGVEIERQLLGSLIDEALADILVP